MPISKLNSPAEDGGARDFRTTHWSVVLLAGRNQSTAGAEALETLCRTYWYPLYAFVRRRGHNAEEAQDLTQGFFAKLLEKNYLGDADAGRGKFRTFLLASLNHYLANEWDRTQRQKRGGGCTILSLFEQDAEGRYALEPAESSPSETIFDRHWAETMLELVFARLRREFADTGNGEKFDALKQFLVYGDGATSYEMLAASLGVSETGVRSIVHRLRKRFRQLMREEIANTISRSEDIDEEIRYLFEALSA